MTRRRAVLVGGAATALVALGVWAAVRPAHQPAARTSVALPAPAGPIVAVRRRVVISPAQLAQAQMSARRFLAGYLPYVYGRARARSVQAVLPSVATALRRYRPHVTPAQQRRHPRVRALALQPQTTASIQVTATIADGGVAPYALSFTLERRGRHWLVSDLASD